MLKNIFKDSKIKVVQQFESREPSYLSVSLLKKEQKVKGMAE
jgi:hypothetical protein